MLNATVEKTIKLAFLILTTLLLMSLAVQAATPNPCAFKTADLTKILGAPFHEGKPESSAGFGPACTYKSKGNVAAFNGEITLWVGFIPSRGNFDSMKIFLGPPSTKYHPVAKDADNAMIVEQSKTFSVPSFPDIVYMRGGQLVQLHIMGGIYPQAADKRKKLVDEYNKKLLALPRLP